MIESTKLAMSHYADFKTRTRRKDFWLFQLATWILAAIALFIDSMIGMSGENGIGPVGALVSLALLVPSISITARRLHDVGYSGWLMLVIFVPLIGGLALLVMSVLPSKPEVNKWGEPANL